MYQQQPQDSHYITHDFILQPILEHGFDGIHTSMAILFDYAMFIERSRHLNAASYERTSDRNGYANGFKDKTIMTRLGKMKLNIPQTRDSSFYPTCLEKGIRSERALLLTLAEMYIHGVSTRDVTHVLQELCGCEISSAQVSRACQALDEEITAWRNRELGEVPFVIIDARYEKVRHGGVVVDCALLIAYGVLPDGRRTVLGVSCKLSEAEVNWRFFLESLVKRGLHGVKLIVSDSHAGLKAARMAVFPSVPWQRCQFHLQQNAQSYIPKKSMNHEVHETIRAIFNATSQEDAERLLKKAIEEYEPQAPKLSEWMEENIPEGLTIFSIFSPSSSNHSKLRTSNMAERENKELKKRTHKVRIFTNEDSLIRLAGALLMELDEKWSTDQTSYLKLLDGKGGF